MIKRSARLTLIIYLLVTSSAAVAFENNRFNPPTWLTVSDKDELNRTWSQATVFLPGAPDQTSRQRPIKISRLTNVIGSRKFGKNLPTILYLHSCEGPGHHREDLRRFAKLGFVVIAPDSNAREHKRLGCHEEREKFVRYLDLAIAFKNAELEYAVQRLGEFSWIDRNNLFLVGSGLGGMVAAHHQGGDFAGIVIEGWGCRGPNPIFDGIWAPPDVRVFSTVSRNDPWYAKNPGFDVDCESYVQDRADSVSVVIDRPAHYVSWYPKSIAPLILFLTRDLQVDSQALAADIPVVVEISPDAIKLRERWSDEAVYAAAREHCSKHSKGSHLITTPQNGVFSFVCE